MTIQLTRFLMKLSNELVAIDMKDGSSVTGTVIGADTLMNISLKEARIQQKNGEPFELNQLTVRGNTIRYIQLPDSLNIDNYVKNLTTPAKDFTLLKNSKAGVKRKRKNL